VQEDTYALIAEWVVRLRTVARRTIGGEAIADTGASDSERLAFLKDFVDERGHRARVVTPFLAAALGVDPGTAPVGGASDLDDRLWWAVLEPERRVVGFERGDGPLDPGLAEIAIESRTETELSAMHALFRLGLDRGVPAMVERALDAARWQVAELQPDNGTNHPWGIHVFVVLAARSGDAEESGAALMHAQTLLHNCQVQQGRADRLSACILWDAGETLGRVGFDESGG
jgi:hypothetical protein